MTFLKKSSVQMNMTIVKNDIVEDRRLSTQFTVQMIKHTYKRLTTKDNEQVIGREQIED